MRIHIDQIKEDGLQLSYAEPAETFNVLSELIQDRECEFLAPIGAQLQIMRISGLVKVDGTFNTTLRQNCDRCLKEFETDLENDFTLTYTPDLSETTDGDEEERELSTEEMGLMQFRGEEIDLRAGIQEQVVLALPLQTLCSPACKGLCPQCGADLNKADCSCSKVAPTGKFAALRELKLKDS